MKPAPNKYIPSYNIVWKNSKDITFGVGKKKDIR